MCARPICLSPIGPTWCWPLPSACTRKSIGTLRMPLNEGLTGLVAERVLPVAVEDVRNHPRFKYFKESGEDEYHSFLGVPLIDRGVLQGVLVVQTHEPRALSGE